MGDRLLVRLVLGLLAVALIPATVLAVLVTRSAASSLEDSAKEGLAKAANGTAARIGDEVAERRSELQAVATGLEEEGAATDRGVAAEHLAGAARAGDAIRGYVLTTLRGREIARSKGGRVGNLSGRGFFEAAAGGRTALSPIEFVAGGSRWLAAAPVRDRAGRPVAVLVGRLERRTLDRIIAGQRFGDTGEVILRDRSMRVLALTSGEEEKAIRVGRRTESEAARRASAGERGAIRYVHPGGHDVIGGYAPVGALNWGLVVNQKEDEAFAAVSDARNLAILLLVLTVALAIGFAFFFADRLSGPIRRLAEAAKRIAAGELSLRVEPEGTAETKELASAFNGMLDGLERLIVRLRDAGTQMSTSSTELSSASDELAATTNQQNAAATQTSTTMEELAATSASIAENIEAIAEQTGNTRAALAQADEDMQTSSARTLGLARRVDEIGGILELIDELADRTSLLSLNAAIEAARAGESGAGFTVVADEVRKLAERSKQSSAEIAEIVAGTQAETNATVIAMETGSKQMRRGLELMDAVATATDQARLTTEQQRAASVEVVEAMQSVTAASRQAASTAQQLAQAAGTLTQLASDLEDVTGSTDAQQEPDAGAKDGRGDGPGSASNGGQGQRGDPVTSGRRGRG